MISRKSQGQPLQWSRKLGHWLEKLHQFSPNWANRDYIVALCFALFAMLVPLVTSRNNPVGREKRLTGKICFRGNPKSPKASEHKGFTLPSRSYLPLMSKDFRVTSAPLMRVLRGEMKGLFMFTAALMPQAGLLFCLSQSNLSASYAPSGSVPISGRVALESACLMPQGLRKQPDLPRQLAHCPKKSFLCPENGQSRTKFKHKSNQNSGENVSRFIGPLHRGGIGIGVGV